MQSQWCSVCLFVCGPSVDQGAQTNHLLLFCKINAAVHQTSPCFTPSSGQTNSQFSHLGSKGTVCFIVVGQPNEKSTVYPPSSLQNQRLVWVKQQFLADRQPVCWSNSRCERAQWLLYGAECLFQNTKISPNSQSQTFTCFLRHTKFVENLKISRTCVHLPTSRVSSFPQFQQVNAVSDIS